MSAKLPSNMAPNPSEDISGVSEPFFKIPPFPPKTYIVRGIGEVPEYFFLIGILICSETYGNPFWEKSNVGRGERKRENKHR
jgi:hypothetical protein